MNGKLAVILHSLQLREALFEAGSNNAGATGKIQQVALHRFSSFQQNRHVFPPANI